MDRRSFLAAAGAGALVGIGPAAAGVLKFRELYGRGGSFSQITLANAGKQVSVGGFMAPPLKARSKFFVLTKLPMSFCPFCEDEAEWPDNIIVVYTKEIIDVVPFNRPIVVTGVLDLGDLKDEETGFYSKLRLMQSEFALT